MKTDTTKYMYGIMPQKQTFRYFLINFYFFQFYLSVVAMVCSKQRKYFVFFIKKCVLNAPEKCKKSVNG